MAGLLGADRNLDDARRRHYSGRHCRPETASRLRMVF
jgi:hypothetical protein